MVKKKITFKTIGLYSSLSNKNISRIANHIYEVLNNLNIKVVVPNNLELKNLEKQIKPITQNKIINECDLIIAIGGDGTLISSARTYGYQGLPILGVNLGNLGFLTDIPPESLTTSLIEIAKGSYKEDHRFFLESSVNKIKRKHVALNEVVIHSGQLAQMFEYELYLDDIFVYRQKADGIIISTPTGSTAYSLSGNGSIIHPDVKAINLLPMFPHSLNARPLIIDHESIIKIKVRSSNKNKTKLSMDSHNSINLKQGDEVIIKKALPKLKLIHPNDHNFYEASRNKLGWSLNPSASIKPS
tara:strand:+ start:44 stop:943 length:900 start_codon:yes stop_codon:yes gene_type:complete